MLLTCAFLFVGVLFNQGQDRTPYSLVRANAPDAEVTDVGWSTPQQKLSKKSTETGPSLDTIGTPSTSTGELPHPLEGSRGNDNLASPESKQAPPPDDFKVAVYPGIRNTGPRAITAIDWEIIFCDNRDGSGYFVLHFRSEREVLPGQSVQLSQKFPVDERWNRVQESIENQSAIVKASIVGVEYADGSSWKRSE